VFSAIPVNVVHQVEVEVLERPGSIAESSSSILKSLSSEQFSMISELKALDRGRGCQLAVA